MAGHIHHKHVADAPFGSKPGRRGGDLAHQFVGMQAALHQELTLSLPDQGHCRCRSGVAMRHVDNLVRPQIKPVVGRYLANLRFGSDQHRNDQTILCGLQRAAQRGFVTGVRHDRDRRRDLLRGRDQAVVF
jgi:hypothetical protein